MKKVLLSATAILLAVAGVFAGKEIEKKRASQNLFAVIGGTCTQVTNVAKAYLSENGGFPAVIRSESTGALKQVFRNNLCSLPIYFKD